MLPSPFRIAASRARKRSAADEGPADRGQQTCEATAPTCSRADDLQRDVASGQRKQSSNAAQRKPAVRRPLLPIAAEQNLAAEPLPPPLGVSPARIAASLQHHAVHSSPDAHQQAGISDRGRTPRAIRRRALVLPSPESPDTARGREVAEAGPARSGAAANDAPSAGLRLSRTAKHGTLDAFLQPRPSDAASHRDSEPEEAAAEPAKPWKRPRLTVWCEKGSAALSHPRVMKTSAEALALITPFGRATSVPTTASLAQCTCGH